MATDQQEGAPHAARQRARRLSDRRAGLIALAAVALEAGLLWWRVGRPGGWLVVRCREGHLFTTLWIPGASLKSVRLGLWRLQRCPVGRHLSLVTPVREARLDDDERRRAAAARDLALP
jgi:hypothetical protein